MGSASNSIATLPRALAIALSFPSRSASCRSVRFTVPLRAADGLLVRTILFRRCQILRYLRVYLFHGIAQANAHDGLAGVLQNINDLAMRVLEVFALAVSKQLILSV